MKLIDIFEDNKLLDVPTLTAAQLASKHKVPLTQIEKEIKKGIAHEKEHTSDPKVAREIAMDHLKEDPKYYEKLDKALPES